MLFVFTTRKKKLANFIMDYKILVVDDDEHMHVLAKALLGKEFTIEHARNAQQAIDLLSEQKFHLILSDIHMPGLDGLEFLESLMKDAEKQRIPVLIMTNLPTVEKEQKALNIGAADFIDKVLFTGSKEKILQRIRMKLVTRLDLDDAGPKLVTQKNRVVDETMKAAIKSGYNRTIQTLCKELTDTFKTDHLSFWAIEGEEITLSYEIGLSKNSDYDGDNLKKEYAYEAVTSRRKPYMTNHVGNDSLGIMSDFSEANDLSAEIGVPLFAVNERTLLLNNMEVPEEVPIFGMLILKRNRLYSSKEFDMISRLLTQTGSILWRLSNNRKAS